MLTSVILIVDVVCDVAMTSSPNVLTTELRDVLYNQCIDKPCCCSFFIYPTGRIRVCKIRFVSTGENRRKSCQSNDKYFTPIRCLRYAWILCWLECVNTTNIPHLFKPFLRPPPPLPRKKRMCIVVNEWPKENVVRLISRNFWIWIYIYIYLFIISTTYYYFI